KRFSEYSSLSVELKLNFLARYFSDNKKLQALGERLILDGKKDLAKELNDMISIFGGMLKDEDVNRLYNRFYNYTAPRNSQSASTTTQQSSSDPEEVQNSPETTLFLIIVAVFIGIIIISSLTIY
ncbi:hypothetical protein, partial [Rhodoblastus sp.]